MTYCATVQARLPASDRLDSDARRELELHLGQCPTCKRVAAQLTPMLAAARRQSESPLAADVGERVWARLAAPPRPASRRVVWPPWAWAGAALATAAAATVAIVQRPSPTPELAVPSVAWVASSGTATAAAAVPALGEALVPGAWLHTGGDGRALLEHGGARLALAADTDLRLLAEPGLVGVELARGGVFGRLRPDGTGTAMVVETPQLTVRVVGTVFSVARDGHRTEVAVAEGRVAVTLVAGQQLQVGAGTALEVADGRVLSRSLTPDGVAAMIRGLDPQRWHGTTDADTGSAPDVPGPAWTPKPQPRAAEHLRDGACAAAEGALTRTDPVELWTRVAECYLRASDLQGARRLYARTGELFAGSPAGSTATYEAGRLALSAGDAEAAQGAFAAYLQRAPKGALAGEARFRLCSLAAQSGRSQAAVTCLRRYRVEQPQGARRADSFLLEATLLRTAGDCAGAITAYDGYLAAPGPYAEQARQWRLWCAERGRP